MTDCRIVDQKVLKTIYGARQNGDIAVIVYRLDDLDDGIAYTICYGEA